MTHRCNLHLQYQVRLRETKRAAFVLWKLHLAAWPTDVHKPLQARVENLLQACLARPHELPCCQGVGALRPKDLNEWPTLVLSRKE